MLCLFYKNSAARFCCCYNHMLSKMIEKWRTKSYLAENYCNSECQTVSTTKLKHPKVEKIASECLQLLVKELSCSHRYATKLMTENKLINTMDLERLHKTLTLLKTHFEVNDILTSPRILSLSPELIERRLHVLQETGFSDVTVGKIVRFTSLLKKTPHQLKAHGLLPPSFDLVENITTNLSCPVDVKGAIKTKLVPFYTFNCSIMSIRKIILVDYLAWKLHFSMGKILELIQKYPSLISRSYYLLEQTIKLLMEHFEFSKYKLGTNGFLLTVPPDSLESIITNISTLRGVSIKHLALEYPRILCMPVNTLREIEKHLRDFHISNKQIQHCGNIYTLSSKIVKNHLEDLSRIVNEETMKSYIKILFLVYHHSNPKERIRLMITLTLQKLKLGSPRNFIKLKYYKKCYSSKMESIFYLSKFLGRCRTDVAQQLQLHPKSSIISPFNTRNVVNLLLCHGFTRRQIWYGLPIVLYDINVIKDCLQTIPYQDIFQSYLEAKTHYNFLQLLLYYIEKDNNFTGGGIYARTK